ncbi:MAG: flavodoxin [Bacteroidota bacterium]|nr:flavodoxin [Bacteroidota bacterium]
MKGNVVTLLCVLFMSTHIVACYSDGIKAEKEKTLADSTFYGKVLVVYYSWSGNSRTIASDIHQIVGGDLVKVELTTPYSATSDSELFPIAQQEIAAIDNKGQYPSIKTQVDDMDKYTAVIVCNPLWYSRMATPMQAFLHKYSSLLAGKTIALFCTSRGVGISGSVSDAKRLCPDAYFTDSLWIKSADISTAHDRIEAWLKSIQLYPETNSDYVKLKMGVGYYVDQSRLFITGTFSQLTLLNMNGTVIRQTKQHIIDLSDLPAGCYLVKIAVGAKNVTFKISR